MIAFACIAVSESRLLGRKWPETVLSAGAGISIAYVVVHVLPELAQGAEIVRRSANGTLPYAEVQVYVLVLVGIIGTLLLRSIQLGLHGMTLHPRIRLVQPALSALIVGYLLAVRDDPEVRPLLIFAIAIGLHITINAHGLVTKLGSPLGGVALAATIAIGFGLGSTWEAPAVVVAGFVALLAGGVMTRTIRELVDQERHLIALIIGAGWRLCCCSRSLIGARCMPARRRAAT